MQNPRRPRRFLALYVGHGFALHGDWRWYPTLVEGQLRFGKSMEAFTPLAKRITVVQGLEHPQCVSAGGHSTADSFLTGSNPAAAVKSPSLDQIAATHMGIKRAIRVSCLAMKEAWAAKADRTRFRTINSDAASLRRIIYEDCMMRCLIPIRPCRKSSTDD